ncbi:MAG: hypothetical protein CME06_07650 [Gemmatimonadetes bacterium]|nr:hypothetical protein [Gemmatimonadota bacterium]
MEQSEIFAPLIDLLFYTLAFLALTPLLKLVLDLATAGRPSKDAAPEIEAWRKEAEEVMARASIVPLRRRRRRTEPEALPPLSQKGEEKPRPSMAPSDGDRQPTHA